MKVTQPRRWVPLLVAALLLTSCGGATPQAPTAGGAPAASSPSAPTQPLQQVTLRLGYLVQGDAAAEAIAKQRGYYKDAGFDVSIQEGKGSATTVETVGNGSDTFGIADAATEALLVSKGAPVKELAVFLQQSPFAFVYNKSTRFQTPRDLFGRTIVTNSGAASLKMLPAVLGPYGVDMNQLKIVYVDPTANPQTLKQHPDYILLGNYNADYFNTLKINPDAIYAPYTKFGLVAYSSGLITDLSMIQQHADEVRRFTAATIKGWGDVIQDPQAGIDAIHALFPQADPGILMQQLKVDLTMLHTKATEGKPIGWTAESDWQATVDVLHRYGGLENVKPLGDYYTNQFLPES